MFDRTFRWLSLALVATSLVAPPAEAARKKGHRHANHASRAAAKPASFKRGTEAPSAVSPGVMSRTAVVFDEETGQALYTKNDDRLQPIASITKLMTAMVVLDAKLPLDETLTVTWDDVDHLRGSSSRIPVGAEVSRRELMRLALMSSDNRAASALGRNYPGGLSAFVRAMNAKAHSIGMQNAQFADPSGLDGNNRASAMDLVHMVRAAHSYQDIRELSTTGSYTADLGRRMVEFRNTNPLTRNPDWEIGLSKTGYIREAGKCLVMQARIAGRSTILVLLDSSGSQTRVGDAGRVRRWLEARSRQGIVVASNT